MKSNKALVAIIASLVTLMPQFTVIADAQNETQIGVRGRCVADIIGLEEGSRVNMRSAPRVDSEIVGYVLVGQQVAQLYYSISGYSPIVRQTDKEGVSWDYVEYMPSETRGWIASHLLDQTCSSSKRPL